MIYMEQANYSGTDFLMNIISNNQVPLFIYWTNMEIESLPKVQHCSTKYFGQVVGIFLLESLSWVALVKIEKVKTDFFGGEGS